MADATRPAIGLSIGATNLAAVTADRSVSRKPVLTLYGHRPPEVGIPSENPHLDEAGLVITDFVNRVGSSARVVATDGSTHRSEVLLADALRALVYAATNGGVSPEAPKEVVVTYPAHWPPPAVTALRGALSPGSGWLGAEEPVLLDDAAAAVNALQTNPGLPDSGVVAVCDFGGSGTSLTLVDATNGYQRIGATLRHSDFSGDLVDQAVLNHVVADLSAAGSFDTSATSAIGSLTRLRADCRHAKEQLSVNTVTMLTADLPGYRGNLHLTRADLDEAIRQPLAAFVSVIRDVLQLNGIQPSNLVAVAAVGGGANIPVVATTLSDQLRTPVVTAPRPQLIPAIGAALRAARGPVDAGATAPAPAVDPVAPLAEVTTVLDQAPATSGGPALAWSEADDDTGVSPLLSGEYPAEGVAAPPPPAGRLDEGQVSYSDDSAKVPWYRRTVVLIIAAAMVLLAIAGAIMLALHHTSGTAPVTPTPGTTTGSGATTSAPQSTASQNPTETSPSDTNQPSSTTSQAPSSTSEAPSTTTTTTEPSTQTSTSQITTTQPPQYPPNRPFGPGFPRGPGYPEPGQGQGVQEPGRGGR